MYFISTFVCDYLNGTIFLLCTLCQPVNPVAPCYVWCLLFSFLFCTAFPLACPFNLRLGLLLQGSASVRKIFILQNVDFPILKIDNVIHYQQNLINEIQVNKGSQPLDTKLYQWPLQIMQLYNQLEKSNLSKIKSWKKQDALKIL